MPTRTITISGTAWQVQPSGFVTANVRDEFGLIFVAGTGEQKQVRVTRYSPLGSQSRDLSLAELTDQQLLDFFAQSQPSATSPEAGYRP